MFELFLLAPMHINGNVLLRTIEEPKPSATKKAELKSKAIEAGKLAITLQSFALEFFLLLITRSMIIKLFM